jgi:hypothetical protein
MVGTPGHRRTLGLAELEHQAQAVAVRGTRPDHQPVLPAPSPERVDLLARGGAAWLMASWVLRRV